MTKEISKKCSCCGKVVRSKGKKPIWHVEVSREIMGKDFPDVIESDLHGEGYYCSIQCAKKDFLHYDPYNFDDYETEKGSPQKT